MCQVFYENLTCSPSTRGLRQTGIAPCGARSVHEVTVHAQGSREERSDMDGFFTKERIVILIIVIVAGLILGRLIPRTFLNMLLGGTLFGGDIL